MAEYSTFEISDPDAVKPIVVLPFGGSIGQMQTQTVVTTLDDSGEVGGYFYNSEDDVVGFVEANGAFKNVLDPSGAGYTAVEAINNTGTIAGIYRDSSGDDNGFILKDNSFETMDAPDGAKGTVITAINDSNVVVGTYYDSAGKPHGFSYDNGQFSSIDDSDGVDGTTVAAINAAGEVVGTYYDANDKPHGFTYDGGVYTPIDDNLGVDGTKVVGVNALGEIAGVYYDSADTEHGFIYEEGSYTTIDAMSGVNGTIVTGINASGEVTGSGILSDGGFGGFVYDDGVFTPLQTSTTVAINDSGQVAGNGTLNGTFSVPHSTPDTWNETVNVFDVPSGDDWSDGASWDKGVPRAGSDVVINTELTTDTLQIVVLDEDTASLNSLTLGQKLHLGAYTLSVGGEDGINVSDGARLLIGGGEIEDAGGLSLGSGATLQGWGEVDVDDGFTGDGTVEADGGTLTLSSSQASSGIALAIGTNMPSTLELEGQLTTPDTISLTSANQTLEIVDNASLTIASSNVQPVGATIQDFGSLFATGNMAVGSTGVIQLQGLLYAPRLQLSTGGALTGSGDVDLGSSLAGMGSVTATGAKLAISGDVNSHAFPGTSISFYIDDVSGSELAFDGVVGGASNLQSVAFDGAGSGQGTLDLTNEGRGAGFDFYATVSNFLTGDKILVAGAAGDQVGYSGGMLEVEDSTGAVQDEFAANGAPGDFSLAYDPTTGFDTIETTATAACYCRGTCVLTERGEVAVEDLAVGDLVVTASGERRPIRWIGHRSVDCRRHPDPEKVWPVRIAAGAIAPNLPVRDLLVSPEHALWLEDALVPARDLVNGATIRQEAWGRVEYFHVELESHEILLAEGMPAESYLDCDNRAGFDNAADGVVVLHPDWSVRAAARPFATLALAARLRAAFAVRAAELGRAAEIEAFEAEQRDRGRATRTNFVRNPRAEGSVCGALGSGGEAPLHWWLSAPEAVAIHVVGVGREDDLPFLDLRFVGRPAAPGYCCVHPEPGRAAEARVGQNWTVSCYLRHCGARAGLTAVNLYVDECGADGAYLTGQAYPQPLPTPDALGQQRISATRRMSRSDAAATTGYLQIGLAADAPVDFTLRIAGMQIECGRWASGLMLPPPGEPGIVTRHGPGETSSFALARRAA